MGENRNGSRERATLMDASDWKIVGLVAAPVVGLYGWFIRHVSGTNRHPKADDLVYSDVCEERGKANEQAHLHLKEGIEAAIARSDEKHTELKADMRAGFSEIKTLLETKL